MQVSPPLLSICMVARNDSYHGDYTWRLTTCLNILTRGLSSLGRLGDMEIVLCDWGSEIPLHEALVLPSAARDLVRFLVVPPQLAIERQQDAGFAYTVAMNAAVRRSRGQFVSDMTADVVLMPAALHALLAVLEGKYPGVPYERALLTVLRRQMPMRQVRRRPSVREIEEYMDRNLTWFPADIHGVGYGFASGVVMHRSIWEECQGLDETMLHWGWSDIDFALRLTERYPIVELANFGVCGVHLQHYDQTNPNDKFTKNRRENLPMCTPPFVANDAGWGLAGEELPFHQVVHLRDDEPADATALAGTIEPWSTTSAELLEELLKPEWEDKVMELLNGGQIEPMWRPSLAEINALAALYWHAQRRATRTYVEVGLRGPHAACIVSRASPGVEIYALTDWEGKAGEYNPLFYVGANLLRRFGQHDGYRRFVGGDPATAVQRMVETGSGRFAVDLALVRGGKRFPLAPQQACAIAQRLTPGGALVLFCEEADCFQELCDALTASHPDLSYVRFPDECTGLALAAELAD